MASRLGSGLYLLRFMNTPLAQYGLLESVRVIGVETKFEHVIIGLPFYIVPRSTTGI